MSRVARQKHIKNELWTDDYSLPKENQKIAKIRMPKGNNLHEVRVAERESTTSQSPFTNLPFQVEPEDSTETCLASMPTKFRRNVWVKRGDFVLIEAIDEGDKVKAEIVRVLTPEHVKEYTKANLWPKKFVRTRDEEQEVVKKDDDEEVDSMDEEFQNPNRRGGGFNQDESDETTDSDDD